jgi:hypothetical protein
MITTALLIPSLLLGFVQANETEDPNNIPVTNLKLGNQTIERVSILIGWLSGRMVTAYINRFPGLFCGCA